MSANFVQVDWDSLEIRRTRKEWERRYQKGRGQGGGWREMINMLIGRENKMSANFVQVDWDSFVPFNSHNQDNYPKTTGYTKNSSYVYYPYVASQDDDFSRNRLRNCDEGKAPYKCPCCDGWGKRIDPEAMSGRTVYPKITCSSCSGTGIVWG